MARFRPNITLLVRPLTKKMTPSEIRRDIGRGFKHEEVQTFSVRETKLGGLPAYAALGEKQDNGVNIRIEQVVVVYNSNLYILTGTAPASHASTYGPLFQKVFQSTQFLK